MKPCDCKDAQDLKKLSHNGTRFNGNWIEVEPAIVRIRLDRTTIEIPQFLFERFAKWYLEDQPQGDTDAMSTQRLS